MVTLFTLLLVMALERVTEKSSSFHISALAPKYFDVLLDKKWVSQSSSATALILMALIPALFALILISWLPALLVFILYVLVLWICLGCPETRQSYKRYLQAAHNEDLQACSLHSLSFGNKSEELSQVAKHLVMINYRQYAAVIIFFVFFGAPCLIFYSLVKGWARFAERS